MAAKLCIICHVRRPKTGSKGLETSDQDDVCNYCYEEGGHENSHSDNDHASLAKRLAKMPKGAYPEDYFDKYEVEELNFMQACWLCHPELNLAKQPVKAASTAKKTQGDRRPQFNHKGHRHPQTPAARRACKEAFWAQTTVNSYSADQLSAAQAEWDYDCDGHGKLLPKKKESAKPATWAKVTPRGPKGGVIKQLKEGKPKKVTKKPLHPATPSSYEIVVEEK